MDTPNPALANTVSSQIARVVLDTAVACGIDAAKAARAGTMDPHLLHDDLVRVPSANQYRLWLLMHHVHGDQIGVRAAEVAEPGRLGAWDYLLAHAPTLPEGLRDAARFAAGPCDPRVRLQVHEQGSMLTVTHHGSGYGEIGGVVSEFAMILLTTRARAAFGDQAAPVRVDFAHPAPRDHRVLAAALGTDEVHFGQRADKIHYRLPVRHADPRPHDPYLRRIVQVSAQRAIDEARPIRGWLETFRATLRLEAARGHAVPVAALATRLEIGDRTLQRRLSEAGTSWSAELAAVRRDQVTHLLRNTSLTVQTIALRTGYSDARALSRAFDGWTGQSPSAYRRAHRETN
ncbi:helix-turn-helix domain-containing protein [Nocardia heshunensis]